MRGAGNGPPGYGVAITKAKESIMAQLKQTIADKLRLAIARAERNGTTRYRIAKDADVAEATVHNIVHGRTPRLDIAEKLARAVGCELRLTRKP